MDREQLIAAVARETGVKLSSADPILAAAAVNEILLDQALAKLDKQVKGQADRVTAASTQAVADATKSAELVVTEAAAWIENRIKEAGAAAAASVLSALRQEADRSERASRNAIRAVWAAGIICLFTLCGIGGMLLAVIGPR